MPKCHAGGVHGSKGAREWVYTQVCHGIGCHGTGLVCKQQVFAKSGFGQSCVGLRVQAAVDPIIESPTTAKLPLYLSGAPSTHHQQWLLDSSPRSKPRIAGRNANLARAQLSHDTATHCTHSPRKLLSVPYTYCSHVCHCASYHTTTGSASRKICRLILCQHSNCCPPQLPPPSVDAPGLDAYRGGMTSCCLPRIPIAVAMHLSMSDGTPAWG